MIIKNINDLLEEKKYLERLLVYYFKESNDTKDDLEKLNTIAKQIESLQNEIISYYEYNDK
jgi:hypothetical protein